MTVLRNGTLAPITVGAPDDVITVTPVIGAAADFSMDAGDVATANTEIPNAVREPGGTCILTSVVVTCAADIEPVHTLQFFNVAASSLGAVDTAPNINAATLLTGLGHVPVAASDWLDLGTVHQATVRNINLELKAAAGSTSLYFQVLNGAAVAAFGAANALQYQFGLMRS